MMNRFILSILFLVGLSSSALAQRYCYVDSQYILDQMPEYKEAQTQIDDLSKKWQEEIEAVYAKVSKRQKEYDAEAILLPDEIKKEREAEIAELETEARELQKQYFGIGGELFTKRQELIQPIQDRIFEAIQDVADEKKYAFVFDKANQSTLLFADPKYDISDLVLRKMGINVNN